MSREAKVLLGVIVVIIAGMVGIFIAFNKPATPSTSSKPTDAGKFVRNDSHKSGNGKVTVVEFGDFQCPACKAAEPNLAKLRKEYDGKITFVFRNFPLPMHKNAPAAALAAEAANAQGKFWEMHDKLYETQDEWNKNSDPSAAFADYAAQLGLDRNKILGDIENKTYKGRIDADIADGEALKVQGTPTIFVNGTATADFSYPTVKKAIDDALAKG